MTNEIPRHSWEMFLNDLTKRRFDWETKVEILSDEFGSQILEDGLPLCGFTVEGEADNTVIEIMLGIDEAQHQTHNVKNPTKIAYLGKDENPGGIVEFVEADGTKTLVHILQPMPLVVEYGTRQNSTTA